MVARGVTARTARDIAAHWVHAAGVHAPGCVGAFLHGSINWLPDDALVPATSDVDVMLVLAGDAPQRKPGKLRHRGVLLEISCLPLAEIADAETVLGNAHLAGSLQAPSVLADPTGHLRALHREVAHHYADEYWLLRRCADVEAKMRRQVPAPDDPFRDQVNAWLFPTGLTTHLLLVAGLRNPTVRLRYLAVRELLREHGRTDVYAGLLDDLGVASMTQQRATTHLGALEAAFRDAARVIRSPFFFAADISEAGYPVAIEGTRELITRGDHREAIFWLAATAVRCQQVLAQDAPHLIGRHAAGFLTLLSDLGIRDPVDLVARRDAMLGRLPERWNVAREIIAARRDTSRSSD